MKFYFLNYFKYDKNMIGEKIDKTIFLLITIWLWLRQVQKQPCW